jgi:hypothetical protein
VDFGRGMRESKAMLERERWPRERLEAFQHERLAELTAHAAEHSPFWRERLPRGRVRLSDLPAPSTSWSPTGGCGSPTCSSTSTRSTTMPSTSASTG